MKKAEQSAAEVMPEKTLDIAVEIQLREQIARMAADNAHLWNRVLVLAQMNATMTEKLAEFEAKLAPASGKAN